MIKILIFLLFCSLIQSCIIWPSNSYEPDNSNLPNNFSIRSRCGGLVKSYAYNGKEYFNVTYHYSGEILEIKIYFRGLKGSQFFIKNNFIRYRYDKTDWSIVNSNLYFYKYLIEYRDEKVSSAKEQIENIDFNKTYVFNDDSILFKIEIPFKKENLEIEIPVIENPIDKELPRVLRYLWNGRWTIFPLNC